MNALSRSVLTLYSYDKDPDNIELENVLRQCINLISVFRCYLFMRIRPIITMNRQEPLYPSSRRRSFPQQRISYVLLRPDKKYTRTGGGDPGYCPDPSYGAWRW